MRADPVNRAAAPEPPYALDVSHLPPYAMDARAPVWWGNTLMMFIETMTVVLLVASYFYYRQNFESWPPPRVGESPPLARPVPDLPAGTANMLLLAASVAPMVIADKAARRFDKTRTLAALGILCTISIVSLVIRGFEFPALHFRWDENAYASITWGILVMHGTYLLLAAAEVIAITYWTATQGLDEKHASDVTLTAVYWHWMVGTWAVLYLVVYWSPRLT